MPPAIDKLADNLTLLSIWLYTDIWNLVHQ